MEENPICEHLNNFDKTTMKNKADYIKFECQECVKVKGWWVHLRICQECGQMLCCSSSPNQHSLKHFQETGHSIISSAELGENWIYCYKDDSTLNL